MVLMVGVALMAAVERRVAGRDAKASEVVEGTTDEMETNAKIT